MKNAGNTGKTQSVEQINFTHSNQKAWSLLNLLTGNQTV